MTAPVFFAFIFPKRYWELTGEETLEPDVEGFEREREAGGMVKAIHTSCNYRSDCPLYRGYWLAGGQGWTECEAGGHLPGAAWYEYCKANAADCPLRRQHEGGKPA